MDYFGPDTVHCPVGPYGKCPLRCLSDAGIGNGGAFFTEKRVARPYGDPWAGALDFDGIFNPCLRVSQCRVSFANRAVFACAIYADNNAWVMGSQKNTGNGNDVRVYGNCGWRQWGEHLDPEHRSGGIWGSVYAGMGGGISGSDFTFRQGNKEKYQTDGGIGMELILDRVTKQYHNKIAVDRISLHLSKGVHGLLGANGAGKTTLMRMICGILKPDSGTVTFDGVDVTEELYRAKLGYLPQDFGYYPDFTGMDFLRYMAALKGLTKRQAVRRAEELLELVSLKEEANKKIKSYSGGMKQRLGIAQALLNDPQLLILDEPTAGLDPKERVRFRKMIGELGKESVVILSTHIVSDIEHIADNILMMKEGQLIYQGKWEEETGDLEEFYLEQFGED